MTSERARDAALTAVVCLVAGAALVSDAVGGAPRAREGVPPGPLYHERAVFCPPAVEADEVIGRVAIAPAGDEDLTVAIDGANREPAEVPAGQMLLANTGRAAATVVGYGGGPAAGIARTYVEPDGAGAAACAREASPRWMFPHGSSALGADQYLLIYNPFPDEAVVRVSFVTPKGPVSKAGLADVGVGARDWSLVRVNEFILSRGLLSTVVTAVRGRVVAWRALFARGADGPGGAELVLGSPEAAETWYFPEGAVAAGYDERIAVMNPTRREATVSIALVTEERTVQPRKLAELTLPALASKVYSIGRSTRRALGGASAIVQTTNGVGVVAERTIRYDAGTTEGIAAEIGAPLPARDWLLAPAALHPSLDKVIVMSAGPRTARVSLSLVRSGRAPARPDALQDVTLKSGSRLRLDVGPWTAQRPVFVVVEADGPVVAERVAVTTRDVAAVMGEPR